VTAKDCVFLFNIMAWIALLVLVVFKFTDEWHRLIGTWLIANMIWWNIQFRRAEKND